MLGEGEPLRKKEGGQGTTVRRKGRKEFKGKREALTGRIKKVTERVVAGGACDNFKVDKNGK